MPDGLPCLGPATATGDIVHGFGHGHVGLTAGPTTGKLVADIIAGRPSQIDLTPYSARRFA
jgi:D-amino-acid dehydrogenase